MFKQLKLPFFGANRNKGGSNSSDEYDPDEEARNSETGSLWTRVKAVHAWKASSVTVFDFDKDMQSDLSTSQARHHIQG